MLIYEKNGGDIMKIENYYCNDEIDRLSCPLYWNVEDDSYKIGKHKIPSLNSIITSLINITAKNQERKNAILFNLRYFLIAGKKYTDENIDFIEKTYGIRKAENYAKVLKLFIDEDGIYKDDTKENIITRFDYNSPVLVEKTESKFSFYLETIKKELKEKIENPAHFEEITKIELMLKSKIEGTREIELIKKNKKVAWYSQIEKTALPHYHLAKKQSIRENLYYAGTIDLATKDTLYYIEPEANFSTLFIMLYLNILNIDIQKENLIALILTPNGCIEELKIPKISNDVLDDIITSYKKRELLKQSIIINYYSLINQKEILSNLQNLNIDFETYLYLIFSYRSMYRELGFDVNEIISFTAFNKECSLKEAKRKVLKTLMTSLLLIQKTCQVCDVHTAMLLVNEIKNITKETSGLKKIEEMLFDQKYFKYILDTLKFKNAILGSAFKSTEISLNKIYFQKVNYSDVTLQLKLNPYQLNSLLLYLENNLLTKYSNGYTNIDDIEESMEQIINIKEKKQIKTLMGKAVDIEKLYKKDLSFEGCIYAEKYIECEIEDVELLFNTIIIKDAKVAGFLCISLIDLQNKNRFKCYVTVFDPEIMTKRNMTEDDEKSLSLFNAGLTLFFDTFGIKRGNFNFEYWKGKRGMVAVQPKEGKGMFHTKKGKGIMFLSENELEEVY